MKPCKTLRSILAHPKNKEDKEQTSECVYKVPCTNCDKTYVGETGRKLGVRLQEHRTEVEFKTKRGFTRSQRCSTSAEYNKSALTDHALQENHVIIWSDALVIDREPDRATRWIKEAIYIRKEGQQAMNREEGSYQLSHAYDRFLGTGLTYCSCRYSSFWWLEMYRRYIRLLRTSNWSHRFHSRFVNSALLARMQMTVAFLRWSVASLSVLISGLLSAIWPGQSKQTKSHRHYPAANPLVLRFGMCSPLPKRWLLYGLICQGIRQCICDCYSDLTETRHPVQKIWRCSKKCVFQSLARKVKTEKITQLSIILHLFAPPALLGRFVPFWAGMVTQLT